MQCINKSRKDFKDLANHYGVSANKLAQITYKYWEETGSEDFFPTSIYIQNELGKVPYTEDIPGAAKLWDKEYRTDKIYNTAEQANAAREVASKFFPSEAVTIYENSDGKYILSVRKPITDVNDFLIKSLSSKKLNTQEQDDYILVINKLQNEAEGNTKLVNRLQETKRKILNDYEFSQSNDPLISYMSAEPASVIKGELGVNKEQLISLLGSTMYKSNVQSVAVKELLQNAFDAVKIANSQGSQDNPVIDIGIDYKERTVTVSDNGIGMTPEIVQKAFFTIGGSYKGENVDNRLKSGGLGLAKMAFLFSSDYVEVSTVKDGTKTYVKATPEQIQSDNFQLVTSKVNEPNGTTVTVKIPEYYIDENGEKRTIWFDSSPSFLSKPMLGNVTVNVTRKNSWGEESKTTSNKNELPKDYTPIGKAKTAFGDMEIYVAPSNSNSTYINAEILISGLHQFQKTFYLNGQKGRFRTIINILPSVGVKSPTYPINNQREGFRGTVEPEIDDLEFLLKRINASLEKKSIAATFGNAISMNVGEVSEVKREASTKNNILDETIKEVSKAIFKTEGNTGLDNELDFKSLRVVRTEAEKSRSSSFDASGIKINEEQLGTVDTSKFDINKPIFHNNTNMKIEEDGQKVLNELGALMLELKSLYSQTYKDAGIKSRHNGQDVVEYISKQFWGISIDKGYGGVNVHPSVMPFLAVNPFYMTPPSYKGVDAALFLTRYITHIIQHEFNHNYVSGEGSEFTGRLPETEAEFTGIGRQFNKDWMNKLYKLISDNLNTFIKYGEEYKKSSNLGESFEANKITRGNESGDLGTESNGRDLQGNRVGEVLSSYGEEFRRVYEGPAEGETQFNIEGREGNVKPRTFTFKDGTTVKAPFRLNSQQELALNEISDFIDSDETSMTLSGYAGTGKTSLMEMIAEKMRKQYRNIMFSASTNKAAAVLRSKVKKSGFTAATLNKIFGIQVTPDESSSYDAANLVTKIIESKIRPGTVVVIDEASMINENNYNILNDVAEEKGLKIIYVGDAAQLAPVNESKISKVFRDNSRRKVELTKVERTDDNAILKEATNIREGKPLSGESSFNKEGKGVAYIKPSSTNKIKDIIEKFVPALRKDADFFRILAYTNNKIAKYNEAVRNALGYTDNAPRIGEPIVGYHNWGYVSGSKNEATYKFVNSESYKVVNVSKPTVVTKTLEGGRKIPMQTTIIEIEDALGNRQEIMAMDIKGNPQNLANATILAREKARLWDMANSTKGETAKAYRSAANDIDRFLFVNDFIEDESRIVKRNGVEVHPLLQNKVYDFGYAMTVHKSQGSTFTHVLIDDENISSVIAVQNPQRSYASAVNGMDVNLGIEDDVTNQVEVPAELSDVDTSTFKKTSGGDIFASLSQSEIPAEAPITADMVQDDNSINLRQQLEYVAVSRATDTVSIISNAVKSEDTPLNHLPKDIAAQVPEVEQEKPAAKMSSSEIWSKAAEIAEPMGERPITYTPQGKDKQNYIVKEGRIYNKNGEEEFPGENRDKNKVLANLAIKEDRAVLVEYKDRKYVVDNLQNIISVSAKENGNIMKWGEENGDRKAILKLAEEKFRNLIDLKQQRLSTVVPQMMDLLKANAEIHGLEDMKKYLAEHPEALNNPNLQQRIEEEAEMEEIKKQAQANGTFMKAPNGRPTKLTERQWLQVRTKNFKKWFGDWEKEYTPQTNPYKENPWESYLLFEDTGRTYKGKSGKDIPIEVNKGVHYTHPVERITPTENDPFGFNSYRINDLISIGKEIDADRPFDGICQTTANACKDFLKNRYGIESRVVIIGAKSPVKDAIINHWVDVLSIDGEAYIYDMPQTEYIKRTKPFTLNGKTYYEGIISNKYTPRLIKVTRENLTKYYEDNNTNDQQLKVIENTVKELNRNKHSISLNSLSYKPAYNANVSKVVDENGEPLVVYHGTLGEFTIFDFNRLGEVTGQGYYTDHVTGEKIPFDSSYAFFFTDNKEAAYSYKNLAIYNQNQFRSKIYWNLQSIFEGNKYTFTKFEGKDKEEQKNFIDNVISPFMGFDVRREANAIIGGKSTLTEEQKKEYAEKFKQTARKIENLKDARSISNMRNNLEREKKELKFILDNKEAIINGTLLSPFQHYTLSITTNYGNWDRGDVYLTINYKDGKYEVLGLTHKAGDWKQITQDNFDAVVAEWQRGIKDNEANLVKEEKEGKYDSKGNIMEVFLNIKNPLEHDYKGSAFPDMYGKDRKYSTAYIAARQMRKARSEGHDGVVYKNVRDPFEMTSYGILGANQVKSATDNNGEFSPENDDIQMLIGKKANAERDRIFYNNLPDNINEYANIIYNELFLKNSKGDIYGFVTPEGKMYFDENNISPNVQIHEYTHLWDRAVSTRNPELWKRGVHLMKRTSLWSEILKDENYGKKWADKGLSEETMEFLIASEVHSRLAGTQGEALLNRIAKEQGSDRIVNKLKQWILDFWKELKGTFSSWSQEELDNLTLDDFLKMTVRDLADAIPLKNNISKQLNSNSEVTFTESTGGYPQRTRENITWSDVTLSFAVDDTTPGEKLTEKEASKQGKYIYELLPSSLKHSDIPRLVRNQVIGMQNDQAYGHRGKVLPFKNIKLNIAGNGIYTLLPKDISQEQINDFVTEYIKEMQTQGITISEIRSGGQTGVDEAGIIAAQRLGIPASIHAPKGYTFRSANGQDISNKEAFTSRFNQNKNTQNNTLVIAPAIAADKKATVKGSISNKFIGFADDIQGSSTANYAQQAGDKANVGNYNSNDVVFVSVPGMRGNAEIRHREQQKTIDEALKALKQGATLVTDNITYTNSSAYNEGEKKLAEALRDAGAEYSDMVVNGETVGIWKAPQQKDNHHTPEQSGQNAKAISTASNPIQIYSDGSDFKGTGAIGYGSVFEYNGKQYGLSGTEAGEEVQRLKAQFPDAKFSNPTMEMLALAATLEHFAELGIGEHIEVNQDYKGAVNYNGLWGHSEGSDQRETKAWKAKEPYIKHLVDRAEAAIKKIEDNGGSVKIRWVKGHAGDRMNDAADSYAKNRDNFNTINDAYGMAQQQIPQQQNLPGPETKINIYAGAGENADLSNFAVRPFEINNFKFESVEQAYQYGKFEILKHVINSAWTVKDAAYKDAMKKISDVQEALLQTKRDAFNTDKDFGAKLKSLGGTRLHVKDKDLQTIIDNFFAKKKVENYINWEEGKTASNVMKGFIKASFEQNPQALQRLLATGNATLTHTQDKGKWGTEFPRLLMEVRDELRGQQPAQQQTNNQQPVNKKINDATQKHEGDWTRQEAENNPRTLYIFTDNTDRDSGSGVIPADSWYSKKYGEGHHYPTSTAAVIRGLDNVRPISTMHYFYKTHGFTHPMKDRNSKALWHDSDIEEFKNVIREELEEIVREFNTGKYDTIMFPDGDGLFNTRISNITKERTPQLYKTLADLLHEYGFDSLIPADAKSSDSSQQITSAQIEGLSGDTAQYGVQIDSNLIRNYTKWHSENPTGIVAYRVNKNAFNTPAMAENGYIGNPFNWQKYGEGIANKMFYDWLTTGNNFGESLATEEYRQAIINKIMSSPAGTPILYYKEKNTPSHATTIGYLINNKQLLPQSNTQRNNVYDINSLVGREIYVGTQDEDGFHADELYGEILGIGEDSAGYMLHVELEGREYRIGLTPDLELRNKKSKFNEILIMEGEDIENWPSLADATKIETSQPQQEAQPEVNEKPAEAPEVSVSDVLKNKKVKTTSVYLPNYQKFEVDPSKPITVDADWKIPVLRDMDEQLTSLDDTSEEAVRIYAEMDRVLESRTREEYYQEPSKEQKRKAKEIIDYIRKNRQLNSLLDNEIGLSRTEIKETAEDIVNSISDIVTELQQNPEKVKEYFPDLNTEGDFNKMTRKEIITTVGINNLIDQAKKRFEDLLDDERYDDLNLIKQAELILNNWETVVELAAYALVANEKISIAKNNTDGRYETVDKDFDIEDYEASLDDNDIDGFREENDEQMHWQVVTRTIDALSSMTELVRMAIHDCYLLNKDGSKVLSKFGVPKRVDKGKATNQIISWTQGALNLSQMVDKLRLKSKTHNWLDQLIPRLEDTSGKESDLQSQFYSVMHRPFQLYDIGQMDKGTYVTKTLNSHMVLSDIMRALEAKFHMHQLPLFTIRGINMDALNNLQSLYEDLIDLMKPYKFTSVAGELSFSKELSEEDTKNAAEILTAISNMFGYTIAEDDVLNAITENSLYEMSEGTRFIINALNRQSKLDFSEYDPFEFGKSNSIDNAMQKFLTPLVEELQDEGVNAFFEDGKMYQSNVIPSFLTELFTNFAQEGDNFYNWLEEFYGFSEWFKKGGEWRVPWLNILADKSSIGKRVRDLFDHKVQLTFNKHSYMRNMSPEEYGISVLTEYFSLKTDIKGDVKRAPAWFRVPIQSNKPSSEFIKFVADRSKEYKENITDDMVKYFYPQELDRIDLVRKRNKKEDSIYHIDSFDENGKYFQILTFLNGYLEENGKLVDETGGKLFRNEDGTVDTEKNKKLRNLLNLKLNAEKDLTSEQDADLLGLVKEATRIHMDDSIQKIMDEWEEAGLLEAAKKIQNINDYGRSIKENIENFLWNDFFATNNILQLTIVDKSFYESSIELQKRLAELHAPGARGNKNVVDYKGKPVSDGFYRTFLLDDYKGFISNIIENLTIVFDKAIASAKPEDRAGWEALKDDLVRRPGTLGKDDKGGRYWNINATDAQAFSSLRSYRKKAFIFGKWSPEAEEVFERIINGNGTLSDFKVAFQPLKPFVYGHVKKNVGVDFTGTDGKAVKTSIQNMAVPFQAKNAEYLLFMAGAIIGNQDTGKPNILRAISRVMEESEIEHPTQGIDTAQFKSAIKSGGQAVINLNQFLSDPNGEEKAYAYMKSLIYSTEKSEDNTNYNYDSFVYKTSYDNYALQQEVPEHFRDHSQAEPSQMRANIPADLDYYLPNGEVNRYTWKDDYGNLHDKDAKEIKKEWENTHAEKIEKSFNQLSDRLKLAGTKAERNLALSKILQEEVLSSTRYSTELAQACQVDPRTGEFRIPKGDPVQAKRIEQMQNSIVKRIINKQPIPGGPIVQVSSWGLSSTLHIRYNSKQGGLLMTKEEFEASGMSGTYRQYAKENQAGIAYWEMLAPASTKQLFEKFKNPDGTINLEAVENCSPELLKMITGRIPNEDKYSIAHGKIVGFLPPIAGEAVMFPLEITEVDDSDFDVDKRYCQVKTIYIVNDWAKIKKGLTNKVLNSLANFRKNNLEGYKKWAAKEKMGQSDKDYVFELVDRFTSNPEEFSNTEDALMKSMYAEYKRMLAEDFPYTYKFPEEGTIEALDNKIIDMSWAILSNEMTAAKMLNPGGFEIPKHDAYVIAAYKAKEGRIPFEDLSKKSTKELQKIVNTKRDLAWFNVQMQFYKQNAAGSNLIGVFAVNKTAHAILENDGLMIDIKKYCGELPFEIAGFSFKGLMPIDETLNTKGNYIGKEIGQGVGASADTAKDPWLDSININMSTAGMFIAAQRMRMPWSDAALFMAQDAVVKLLKEVNRKRLVEKGVTLDSVLADKISRLRMKNGFSEGNESIINKQPLSREELIEGLLDSRNLPEYVKERREMIDFKVLLNFQRLRGLAKGIKRPTAITRLNSISSAVGPLIIDNIIKEHVLTDFMKKNNRQGTGFYIIGQDGKPKEADTDTILDMHPILKQFSRTLDSRYSDCPTTILFSDMPAGNRFFKEDILGALPSYIGDKIYDDRTLLNKLSDFYQSYLVIASGFINPENLSRYIKEFPELFTSHKYDEKYPDNAFIQAIKPEYDKKLKRAYLNIDTTGMKEDEKDRLRAAWTDLHKVDPELSMMLLNYGFFRGGMGFSPKTWMSLIPIYVKENAKVNRNGKEISYLDAYRKFPTDKIVPATLISQFIRNNWDNNTLAPMMGGEGTNYNINLEKGYCIVYNENEVNKLKGIKAMRTKEGNETILWMLEGSEKDNEHSRTYRRVLPLGNNGEYIEMSTNPDIKPMETTVSTRDYTESEEFSPTSDMEQDASQTDTPNTAEQSLVEQAKELGELVPYAMQAFSVNEKIANQLLEGWRERVRNNNVIENTKSMIHQLYEKAGSKVNKEEALKKFETLC